MEVRAFVDSSALVVLLDADDPRHEPAWAVWKNALREEKVLVTTNYVIAECVAVVQRRLGVEAVRALLRDLVTMLHVVWVEPDDHGRGVDALVATRRRDLSLVDCISFVVMERLGITGSFAFDRHFAEQGFEMLM
jgi:predicted nucleic acid-binding protein